MIVDRRHLPTSYCIASTMVAGVWLAHAEQIVVDLVIFKDRLGIIVDRMPSAAL